MISLLIDNCIILGQLVAKNVYSPQLFRLKTWVELGQLKLLVPNVLYNEWMKHKEEQISKLKNASNARYNKEDFEAMGIDNKVGKIRERQFQKLYQQVIDIQDLLDSAERFDPSDEVKVQVFNQREKALAPFHNQKKDIKKDSINDALIFFSTIEYAKKNNLNKFYFVTSNHKDFSQPDERTMLHSDLVSASQGTEVVYLETLDRLSDNVAHLSELTLPSEKSHSPALKESILVDTNDPLIDQLHSLLSGFLYKEISFVPLHILANHYPIQKEGMSYFNGYTLETRNDEIFELFNETEWTQEQKVKKIPEKYAVNVMDAAEKMEFIRDKLVGNLVYNISNKNGGTVDIFCFKNTFCECIMCSFNRVQYENVINTSYQDSEDVQKLMQSAYASYKIGDIYQAAKTFIKARKLAEESKLHLTKFIAGYNLSKIEMMIPFYSEAREDKELIKQLKSIDINFEAEMYTSVATKSVVQWIYNENFIKAAQRDLIKLTKNIRVQQLSPLSGHNSYTNTTRLLIYQMLKLDQFIQRNFIVFDRSSEFYDIINWFAESVYASHSIRAVNNYQLTKFDNWILNILLEYSNHEDLIRYSQIYKREAIEVSKQSGDNYLQFSDKIVEILLAQDRYLELAEQKIKTSNRFVELNRKMVRNGLVLAGQCNLTKKDLTKIGKSLITYIERYAIFADVDAINYFINRKGASLKPANVKKIWLASIKNPRLHSIGLHYTIGNLVEKHDITLKLAKWEFDRIIDFFLTPCDECGHQQHQPEVLFQLFRISQAKERRDCIKRIIEQRLEDKFKVDDLVASVTFGIVTINDSFLKKVIDASIPRIEKAGWIQTMNHGLPHERYITLNNLINMCYFLNLDLRSRKFDKLRGINRYYDWLIDMDGFDYSDFDVNWILEFGTIFYQRRMYQSKTLKKYLVNYLRTPRSHYYPKVERAYLNIYVRKIWDWKN